MDNYNTGLGYGIQGPKRVYPLDTEVIILRGRQAGRMGVISYEAKPHPLSSERRFSVHVYNPKHYLDNRTLLLNESGFKVVERENS